MRHKILVSAFACSPNVGSEAGVGWRWANGLAKSHDVTVLTDASRRPAIEGERLPDTLRFVYYRPWLLSRLPLNSWTAQLLYGLWQFGVIAIARALHKRENFDWCLHLTYGVFRQPSFLGFIGIPFVFGPVGGGENAPMRLKRSIRGAERIKEIVRSLLNRLARFDPLLRLAYRKASLIVVRTEETRRALPRPFGANAVVFQEIGIDVSRPELAASRRREAEALQVLFVGRLLGWKGVHIALKAVAEAVRRGVDIEFTVVGDGPCADELKALGNSEGIGNRLRWISCIPQPELFDLYGEMHCMLFPSLHDSGGNVVLEAQAASLPVICLDLGGPRTLVSSEGAFVVPTAGLSEGGVIAELATRLVILARNEALRFEMGQAARRHVVGRTWQSRVDEFIEFVNERVLGCSAMRGVG